MIYWGCTPGEISQETGESEHRRGRPTWGCNFKWSPSLIPQGNSGAWIYLGVCPNLKQGAGLSFCHIFQSLAESALVWGWERALRQTHCLSMWVAHPHPLMRAASAGYLTQKNPKLFPWGMKKKSKDPRRSGLSTDGVCDKLKYWISRILFDRICLKKGKWVWSSSGNWWWTGKPGMLQSTGSQRVGHDWTTELKER